MINLTENARIFSEVRIEDAIAQIREVAAQYPDSAIRVMPDYYVGNGCTIGFTMLLKEPINPELVGVDIGCGMLSYKVRERIELPLLADFIRKNIPAGMRCGDYIEDTAQFLRQLLCYKELCKIEWISSQFGTLGGGNHFIEVDENALHEQYLTVHSGSHNLENQVREIYHQKFLRGEGAGMTIVHDLHLAHKIARMNREVMFGKIVKHFGLNVESVIESVHNYFDGTYVRKRAIDAFPG